MQVRTLPCAPHIHEDVMFFDREEAVFNLYNLHRRAKMAIEIHKENCTCTLCHLKYLEKRNPDPFPTATSDPVGLTEIDWSKPIEVSEGSIWKDAEFIGKRSNGNYVVWVNSVNPKRGFKEVTPQGKAIVGLQLTIVRNKRIQRKARGYVNIYEDTQAGVFFFGMTVHPHKDAAERFGPSTKEGIKHVGTMPIEWEEPT